MKINKVTITGADDNTDIFGMEELNSKYPFVEWGILLSSSSAGKQRYPRPLMIAEIIDGIPNANFSAHLCGSLAKNVMEEQNFDLLNELSIEFKRIQINYNFSRNNNWNLSALLDFLESTPYVTCILQYNKSNKKVLDELVNIPKNLNFLYDASGGRGTEISSIEPPIKNSYTGYAGGINVDNIKSICEAITIHPSTENVWIDLESGCRINNEFDLETIEFILKTAKEYVDAK